MKHRGSFPDGMDAPDRHKGQRRTNGRTDGQSVRLLDGVWHIMFIMTELSINLTEEMDWHDEHNDTIAKPTCEVANDCAAKFNLLKVQIRGKQLRGQQDMAIDMRWEAVEKMENSCAVASCSLEGGAIYSLHAISQLSFLEFVCCRTMKINRLSRRHIHKEHCSRINVVWLCVIHL